MAALRVCLGLLACVTASLSETLGPVYVLTAVIDVNNTIDRLETNFTANFHVEGEYYEWEGFDGWFNNPAHPEWGGAGKQTVKSHLAK